MAEFGAIPVPALAGMAGWEAVVAWEQEPGLVTWRLTAPGGEVRYLKLRGSSVEPGLEDERARMEWAAGSLPVPRVLDHGSQDGTDWLLTAALPGLDATRDPLQADPARLVPLLAAGLRRVHALPQERCPFDWTLARALPVARHRAAAGLVRPADLHEDHGPLTAGEALARLEALLPAGEDLVVCHGDYCFPNVVLADGAVCGYVDLGGLGVADRWWDLAVATWSVTWNVGPGWEDLFLQSYGVERDARRMALYRLLHDLLP